ncbi:hypothetical protein CI109_103549 [Kwoniella shandongensis]|uniref:Uncharacterized protein n=1 Tax=Kwoniella shandongensis TaxID=1734106 RepID=A0A5M6BW47_9TREE|nr:uncharacterized protein CI109_004549 [Kwoniella shandongensis]KAA5527014.1 hypothetical protein CI109_004549 [Kwoniella shandongensis]
MSSKEEEDSKYTWSSTSGVRIEEFVKKIRPSMVTDDETNWIFVSNDDDMGDPEREAHATATGEANKLLEKLEKRLTEIEEDETIPVRAKKGVKSKKAVRDEAHEETKAGLKEVSLKHKWTYGKWMLFPSHDFVDGTWSTLAQSVAKGPLKDAGVTCAKVAPTPSSASDGETKPHLICLYLTDVYDLDAVKKVLEVLLTAHGIEPSSVKSDLYTVAGIDSNHPTKLRSTIWRPAEVIEGGVEAIKALKAQYKPTRKAFSKDDKLAGPVIIDDTSDDEKVSKAVKRKQKPDPSPVPEEEPKDETGTKHSNTNSASMKAPEKKKATEGGKDLIKRQKSAAMRFKENDIFAGSEGDSD